MQTFCFFNAPTTMSRSTLDALDDADLLLFPTSFLPPPPPPLSLSLSFNAVENNTRRRSPRSPWQDIQT